MNKINKLLMIISVFIIAVACGLYLDTLNSDETGTLRPNSGKAGSIASRRPAKVSPTEENKHRPHKRIPAYFQSEPAKNRLPAVLDPERFTGQARAAYSAVREISQTIAQIPCFCYCDERSRHQSLHSCFEDEHGSRCAICINEALTAYRLKKEENLNAA